MFFVNDQENRSGDFTWGCNVDAMQEDDRDDPVFFSNFFFYKINFHSKQQGFKPHVHVGVQMVQDTSIDFLTNLI